MPRKRRKVFKQVPMVTSTVVWPGRREGGPHMVGYARVSMDDQDNQRQIDEMVRFGVHPNDIFTDVASGRDMDRPGWQVCWRDLQKGDLLVIHAVDRLGRDMIEVCQTLKELHDKGVELKILSMDIDTRTVHGRFIFQVMAAFAEMERVLIVERTAHGLKMARERGVTGGRTPKHTADVIINAADRFGVNQAGPKLVPPLTPGGFKKALARARQGQRQQAIIGKQVRPNVTGVAT